MKWTSGDLLRKYPRLYIHEETRWGRHNSAKDVGKCSIIGNAAQARQNSRVGTLWLHNPWCISSGSVKWWDGQMRGVNIAHIKCWVRNFRGFKLPLGCFRDCSVPTESQRAAFQPGFLFYRANKRFHQGKSGPRWKPRLPGRTKSPDGLWPTRTAPGHPSSRKAIKTMFSYSTANIDVSVCEPKTSLSNNKMRCIFVVFVSKRDNK